MQARPHQLTVQMSYMSQAHTHGQDHTWPVQLLSTLKSLTVGSSHLHCITASITSLQFFWYIRLLLTSLCIIWIIWGYLSASTIFPSISHLRVIHSQFSLRTLNHLHLLHSGFKLEALSSIGFSWTRWCPWIHHVPTCVSVFILHSVFHPAKRQWVLWKQYLHHWWGH